MYTTSSAGFRSFADTRRDSSPDQAPAYSEPPQVGLTGTIQASAHFRQQAITKGFTMAQIVSALRNPERVTRVTRYPGQLRYCGAGVAVVMEGRRTVTIYADQVVTDLREDQMNDPAALASVRVNRR